MSFVLQSALNPLKGVYRGSGRYCRSILQEVAPKQQSRFAGQKVRLARGEGRSGNEDGPLHDLPDWHYADGTPAPETVSQRRWKHKRLSEQQRIFQLTMEMKQDIKSGHWQQFY